MRAIRNGLQGAGIPVENSKGEWGPGQEEINVRYADALTWPTGTSILKNGCKEIAYGLGKAVTFMAKWRYDLAGSSSHIHASLWDTAGKTPLFFDPKAEHGMSRLMRRFVAGQLNYARRDHLVPRALHQFLQALPGRHLRADQGDLVARQPHRRLPALRRGHQGHPHRVPHRRRRSQSLSRLCGADRRRPRRHRAEPDARAGAFVGDAYQGKSLREVPKTLREATELMKSSKMLRQAFGDEVVDHYVHTAHWEQFEYDRRITDWELKRGFERLLSERCHVRDCKDHLPRRRLGLCRAAGRQRRRGRRGVVRGPYRAAKWRAVPIAERARYMLAFLDALLAMNDEIAAELAWQMGRPVRYGGEKGGVEERIRAHGRRSPRRRWRRSTRRRKPASAATSRASRSASCW